MALGEVRNHSRGANAMAGQHLATDDQRRRSGCGWPGTAGRAQQFSRLAKGNIVIKGMLASESKTGLTEHNNLGDGRHW
jgi:hypothetical protein